MEGTLSAGRLTVSVGEPMVVTLHCSHGGGVKAEIERYEKNEKCHAFEVLSFTGAEGEFLKIFLDDATRKLIHEATAELTE